MTSYRRFTVIKREAAPRWSNNINLQELTDHRNENWELHLPAYRADKAYEYITYTTNTDFNRGGRWSGQRMLMFTDIDNHNNVGNTSTYTHGGARAHWRTYTHMPGVGQAGAVCLGIATPNTSAWGTNKDSLDSGVTQSQLDAFDIDGTIWKTSSSFEIFPSASNSVKGWINHHMGNTSQHGLCVTIPHGYTKNIEVQIQLAPTFSPNNNARFYAKVDRRIYRQSSKSWLGAHTTSMIYPLNMHLRPFYLTEYRTAAIGRYGMQPLSFSIIDKYDGYIFGDTAEYRLQLRGHGAHYMMTDITQVTMKAFVCFSDSEYDGPL